MNTLTFKQAKRIFEGSEDQYEAMGRCLEVTTLDHRLIIAVLDHMYKTLADDLDMAEFYCAYQASVTAIKELQPN